MKTEDKHLFYFITTNQLSEAEKKWIQSKKRWGGILGMDQKRGFEVGQGLAHLKPNITLASVTFYDYVLEKKKEK